MRRRSDDAQKFAGEILERFGRCLPVVAGGGIFGLWQTEAREGVQSQ